MRSLHAVQIKEWSPFCESNFGSELSKAVGELSPPPRVGRGCSLSPAPHAKMANQLYPVRSEGPHPLHFRGITLGTLQATSRESIPTHLPPQLDSTTLKAGPTRTSTQFSLNTALMGRRTSSSSSGRRRVGPRWVPRRGGVREGADGLGGWVDAVQRGC